MGKWNEALVAGLRKHDKLRKQRITIIPDLRMLRNQQEIAARKAQAKLTSEPNKHIPKELQDD